VSTQDEPKRRARSNPEVRLAAAGFAVPTARESQPSNRAEGFAPGKHLAREARVQCAWRRGQWRWAIPLVAAIACGSDSAHYSPSRDDAAMRSIASVWAEPGKGGLTLWLCEDIARAAGFAGPDGCQIDHLVRGGGLGRAHDVTSPPGGCGGCPHRALAYVRGAVSGGGLTAPAGVRGQMALGSTRDSDPYTFPYTLQAACEEPPRSCELTGTLESDGRIVVALAVGYRRSILSRQATHRLDRVGPMVCPESWEHVTAQLPARSQPITPSAVER
jgi:hypothetical protein